MANNLEDFIQKVKDANDIVSVVSKYLTINKKGKTWWACCPFHYEKKPSFAINEYEQYYHCFGCGVSGDVISFVQKMESCDFYDALKILADNANLKMPEFENDEKVLETKKEKEQIYNILKDAANYYYLNLRKPEANVAVKYLEKRKITKEAIKDFALGYSISLSDIISYLTNKGYSLDEMHKAGIVESKNGRYYDVYAKRLIFPLINSNNNVVGFSARILEKSDFAKYRNTAETLVFKKNNCVYGINNIKKIKQSQEITEIIIVEGQMDVISLYMAGVKNAVACMGTALTINHAKQLKRYCNKVVVCFDGDGAGQKATLRSLDILVSAGLDVFVANMPSGVDPDEYINQFGVNQYKELINNAKYWVEFLIYYYSKQYNLKKADERTTYVLTVLNVIKKLPTASEQDIYLDMVKNITNISVDVLRKDFNNIENVKVDKAEIEEKTEIINNKENAYVKAVKFVISALLHKKDYAKLNNDIKENLLDSDIYKLYEYIENGKKTGNDFLISNVYTYFNIDSNPIINDIVNFNFINQIDNENYYNDCVKLLVKNGLEMKQKNLTQKYAETETMEERQAISKQIALIMTKLREYR